MANKDFHKKFDKGTKTKLHIFNEYFKETFPVFLFTPFWDEVLIYDFFAGKGYDDAGEKSTSLNILEQIKPYCRLLNENSEKKLYIILNDKEYKDELEHNVKEYFNNCSKDCAIECVLEKRIQISNKDFAVYFDEVYEKIKVRDKSAKLIFLDPFNFILDQEKFTKLTKLKATDFICFIPSSYLLRFKDYKGFTSIIDITKIESDNKPPAHFHRLIADHFESLLPSGKEYYIGCFSIKKGSNYYGLIFGSNHSLGAEKFQQVCWKLDPLTGEADYNIDREPSYSTPNATLFEETDIPLKIQVFKQELVNKILNFEITTDVDAYKFALKKRCQIKLASDVLKELISNNKIEKIRLITRDVHKHKPPIKIRLL
jgi:three-Cys-motif partner protein